MAEELATKWKFEETNRVLAARPNYFYERSDAQVPFGFPFGAAQCARCSNETMINSSSGPQRLRRREKEEVSRIFLLSRRLLHPRLSRVAALPARFSPSLGDPRRSFTGSFRVSKRLRHCCVLRRISVLNYTISACKSARECEWDTPHDILFEKGIRNFCKSILKLTVPPVSRYTQRGFDREAE